MDEKNIVAIGLGRKKERKMSISCLQVIGQFYVEKLNRLVHGGRGGVRTSSNIAPAFYYRAHRGT